MGEGWPPVLRWVVAVSLVVAAMPGIGVRPCGLWAAVFPTGVNFRSPIVFLLIMSKPQNVKNRCVSMPSPSAALARMRPG